MNHISWIWLNNSIHRIKGIIWFLASCTYSWSIIFYGIRFFCQPQSHEGLVCHSGAQEKACGSFSESLRKSCFSDGGPIFYFSSVYCAFSRNKEGWWKTNKWNVCWLLLFFQTLLCLSFPKKNLKYYKGVYIVWEIYLIRVPWAEKITKGLRWVLCYSVWTLVGEQPGPGLVIRAGCLSTSKVHAYGWGFHGPSWA